MGHENDWVRGVVGAACVLMAACGGSPPEASPGSAGAAGSSTTSRDSEGGAATTASTSTDGTGAVRFHWTFANGAETCQGAGVETVQIGIGGQLVSVPCRAATGQVATVPGLVPGPATYTAQGGGPWQAQGTVAVVAGETTDVSLDLEPPPGGTYGGLTFAWSFHGGWTCNVAGATEVQVAVQGRATTQIATFPCTTGGQQQGTVPGLETGPVTFTVTGLAAGTVVARADGQAFVTAATTTPFPVDLPLTGPAQGAAVSFTWSFDDSVSAGKAFGCAQSGADAVAIQTNGGAEVILPCYDFAHPGLQGATVRGLPAAPLSYGLLGWPVMLPPWTGTGATDLAPGSATSLPVTLHLPSSGASGTLGFTWSFGGKTCAQAGVTEVMATFADSSPQPMPCNAGGALDGAQNLIEAPGGEVPWSIAATGTGGVQYRSSGTLWALGQAATVHTDLQPTGSGDGALEADFAFGSPAVRCTDAGLDQVHVFVTDGNDGVVPGSDRTVPCASLPVTFPGLAAGTYYVNAEGLSAGTSIYWEQVYNVTVGAGSTARYTVSVPLTH